MDLARPLELELEAGGRGPDTEGLRQHSVNLPAAHPAGVPGQGSGLAEWSSLIGPDPSRYCALIGGLAGHLTVLVSSSMP